MSALLRKRSLVAHRRALLVAVVVAVALALPLGASAQTAPAAPSSTTAKDVGAMRDMQHADTPHAGMQHVAQPAHASSASLSTKARAVAKPAPPPATEPLMPVPIGESQQAEALHGDHGAPAPADATAADHPTLHGTQDDPRENGHALPDATMAPMQGGPAPANALSSDYSDGIAASPAHQLHLHGSGRSSMLLVEQLEAFHARDGNGQSWEVQASHGNDSDKLWLRSEGERSGGKLEDGNLEALWHHNISAYWGSQLGLRHDFGTGPARDWVAVGVQGLAPYWFEVKATGYLGASGRTAARLRVGYEMLFTQRLILMSELEANLYGKNDPPRGIGSGLSDVQAGLRLRYEIRREFAPYVGINWVRRFGNTAHHARTEGGGSQDRQIVAGVRIWF